MEFSTVVTYVPWLGLAGVVAVLINSFYGKGRKEEGPAIPTGVLIACAVAAVLLIFMTRLAPPEWTARLHWIAAGLLVGASVSALLKDRLQSSAAAVVVFASATFVVGVEFGDFLVSGPMESMALVLGLSVGAAAVSLAHEKGRVLDLPVVALSTALVGALGTLGLAGDHSHTGVLVVFGAALAAALAMLVTHLLRGERPLLAAACTVLFFVLSLWFLGSVYLGHPPVTASLLVGVGAALASAWAIDPKSGQKTMGPALGALLWLGVATFSFSSAHGYGMALSALAGIVTLVLIGRRDAWPTVSPILALAVYRLFIELFPNTGRALDIGQHYGLVGLVSGIALAIVAVEYVKQLLPVLAWKRWVAMALAVATVLVLVLASTAFLGQKGSVGLLVGLAIAPAIAALGRRSGSAWLVASSALVAVFLLGYADVTQEIDLDHRQKQALVLWVGGSVLVASVAAAWLGRQEREGHDAT